MNQTSAPGLTGILLSLLGQYLAVGAAFAIPFVLAGAKRIDPHAVHGSWGFRLLILPGTMAVWPLLLWRWAKGATTPPEETNAHRKLARTAANSRPTPP